MHPASVTHTHLTWLYRPRSRLISLQLAGNEQYYYKPTLLQDDGWIPLQVKWNIPTGSRALARPSHPIHSSIHPSSGVSTLLSAAMAFSLLADIYLSVVLIATNHGPGLRLVPEWVDPAMNRCK